MPLKILHLPTSVGGNSYGLAQGERTIGFLSDVLVRSGSWIDYPCNYDIGIDKVSSRLLRFIKLMQAYIKFRKGYDVYHFNYGSSILDLPSVGLHLLDLPFYDRNAYKMVTFNGCDARQRYSTIVRTDYSACHEEDCYGGVCNFRRVDEIKKKRIEKITKYVDQIFAVNPDLLWFLPETARFIPYTVAGFYDLKQGGPVVSGRTLKILHAPTDRGAKGTKYILKALRDLAEKYNNIEIILVEKMRRRDALELYSGADLVIDQLLVGWYGGLAVEVMKMGKPVVCYIREEDLQFIPVAMRDGLPIIRADRYNLFEVLCACIENPGFIRDRAKASVDFVNTWHDPRYVAGIVSQYYS